jgi:hypothetical protein
MAVLHDLNNPKTKEVTNVENKGPGEKSLTDKVIEARQRAAAEKAEEEALGLSGASKGERHFSQAGNGANSLPAFTRTLQSRQTVDDGSKERTSRFEHVPG